MPNHVTNIVTVESASKARIAQIKQAVRSEDIVFDFNTLIPMPEQLVGTTSPFRLPKQNLNETYQQFEARLYTAVRALIVRAGACGGHVDWYTWACENWGTKWNAYDASETERGWVFLTAWSHPEPVIEELSRRFPDVIFHVKYADEDLGQNIGEYRIDNGYRQDLGLPAVGTMEAVRYACEVTGIVFEDVRHYYA